MLPSVVAHRRALHRIPELSDQLPETAAYVRSVLAPLSCTVTTPIPSAICAFFDAGKPETVAFRADMDALPVTERTGLPYASIYPGRMHAAVMTVTCPWHWHWQSMCPRVYQSCRAMCSSSSSLQKRRLAVPVPCAPPEFWSNTMSSVYSGLHLAGLPAGAVYTRPGPLMARANEVTITVTGKSVHLSVPPRDGRPGCGAGLLSPRLGLVEALPPPRVLGFGRMVSGTVRNAVSGETILEGSLRTYQEDTYRACRRV